MDVLLCWSKERSRLVARALHEWLPKALPGLNPWMSELDLDKGKDWYNELHSYLGEAKAVLVSITPENVRSPWIYYECGHVVGQLKTNLVCPFLLDEQPSMLKDGPLGRMQCTVAEKEDTFLLLKTFNKVLGDRGLSDAALGANYEREWPALAGTLGRVKAMDMKAAKPADFIASEADLLAGGNLNSEERTIVLEVGQDGHGMLLCTSTNGGDHFQANGKNLNEENTARSTARWSHAVKSLVRRQILEMKGGKGQLFSLTAKGFELYDLLSKA